MKSFILAFISLVIGFAIYLFFHLGANKGVENLGIVDQKFYLLAKPHAGPFYKISTVIEEVESWAKRNNLSCDFTFGLYIDDPKMNDENRLRSEGGCLSLTLPYDQVTLPNYWTSKTLEMQTYALFKFTGSPAIGPFKVYPAAEKWFADSGYTLERPVLEVYELKGHQLTTLYYFPIKK